MHAVNLTIHILENVIEEVSITTLGARIFSRAISAQRGN